MLEKKIISSLMQKENYIHNQSQSLRDTYFYICFYVYSDFK